jgi:cytochrome P450
MELKTFMSNTQEVNTDATQPEESLAFPFPLADHSLECPVKYDQLRNECPVARVTMPFGGDAYLLTKHEDVIKAFTDPNSETIKMSDGDVPRMAPGRVLGADEGSLFSVSDARHNRMRRLVTQAFTVKHANEVRPRVVAVTNELIDAIERKGQPADLYEDYAIQTPMTVICELLGVPRKDEALFREWGHSIVSTTALTQTEKDDIRKRITDYIIPIIRHEQEHPSDSVIGLLVRARDQGDEVLTEKELFMFSTGLIGAGFETVSTTFTNTAFVVLQRPDLLQQLKERVDEPERMALAIEELLRITPLGVSGRPRITRDELTFSGTTIPTGEVLILSASSGNRDEAVFPHANEADFDRESNPMLTFGRGIHACLGQQLARMELQTLWTTLLKRLPNVQLAVAPSEVPWRPEGTATFGPANLPITW